MSLFKERQASAKKVVELQNKVLSLQAELESAIRQSKKQADCDDCKELQVSFDQLQAEMKTLKSDLKKSRSEATRALNKLAALENQEDV